ncbi:unnamed protein product [Schistocephalus solidus]|uniref:Small integral membrane protein 15 n=1 Tax=Schistocephalus solidus TaxID=70667 RepID=A0A0X3Q5N5_SCHSO|nr:unnamed protein product [Schistocephalus solidus]
MEDVSTTTAPQVVRAGMDKLGDVLSKKLSLDNIPVPQDWVGWLSYTCLKWAVFAAEDPWGFVGHVMMVVGPLFLVSAICSWKLANLLEKEAAEKKQKVRREANISKTRRHPKAE